MNEQNSVNNSMFILSPKHTIDQPEKKVDTPIKKDNRLHELNQ